MNHLSVELSSEGSSSSSSSESDSHSDDDDDDDGVFNWNFGEGAVELGAETEDDDGGGSSQLQADSDDDDDDDDEDNDLDNGFLNSLSMYSSIDNLGRGVAASTVRLAVLGTTFFPLFVMVVKQKWCLQELVWEPWWEECGKLS
jgi:hypothetical protein